MRVEEVVDPSDSNSEYDEKAPLNGSNSSRRRRNEPTGRASSDQPRPRQESFGARPPSWWASLNNNNPFDAATGAGAEPTGFPRTDHRGERGSGPFQAASSYLDFRNPLSSLWAMTSLSPKTQAHLVSVYTNVSLAVGAAALTSLASIWRLLPDAGIIPTLLGIGLLLYLCSMGTARETRRTRALMLYGFGGLQGWGLGPMLGAMDPAIVVTALGGTLMAFVAFTASAVASPRRSQLYLGGLLGTLALVTMALPLLSYLLPRSLQSGLLNTELYLGLFMLCGYILYDTQIIIEHAEMYSTGYVDDVLPAGMLFNNLVGVFVRLLVLLAKASKERERKEREARAKGGSGGGAGRSARHYPY